MLSDTLITLFEEIIRLNSELFLQYACRKTLADSRPRVRGRFAKNDEFGENNKSNSNDTDENGRSFDVMSNWLMIDQYYSLYLFTNPKIYWNRIRSCESAACSEGWRTEFGIIGHLPAFKWIEFIQMQLSDPVMDLNPWRYGDAVSALCTNRVWNWYQGWFKKKKYAKINIKIILFKI